MRFGYRSWIFTGVVAMMLGGIAGAQTPENYLVSFRTGTTQTQRAEAVRGAGAALRFNYSIVNAVAITAANPNALAALQRNPTVTGIWTDHVVGINQTSSGPGDVQANAKPGSGGGGGGATSNQVVPAGVQRVGVPVKGSSDGAGIGIAIVDTGIDIGNTDLLHPTQSFSAFAGVSGSIDTTCDDNHGHGTHVAGIAAALDNNIGVIGVAPAATPYCVKVLDSTGTGSDSNVIAGLQQVATWNSAGISPRISVVNMSLGRPKADGDDTSPLHTAIQNLYSTGVVIVVAAGNDPTKEVKDEIPAGFAEVFAVASTTAVAGGGRCQSLRGIPADTASYFTTDGKLNAGVGVTISAPGEESESLSGCLLSSLGILSLLDGGGGTGTTRMSGTSMATPHVTGVVARMIQVNKAVPTDNNGVESLRTQLRNSPRASRITVAPLDSASGVYTFDGEREGIATAP